MDFAALQDRLRSGPARVRDLAAAASAAFVVLDLLAHHNTDLRSQSNPACASNCAAAALGMIRPTP